jgi:hypothetical protein
MISPIKPGRKPLRVEGAKRTINGRASGRAVQDAWSAMADGAAISLIQINHCQSNEIQC